MSLHVTCTEREHHPPERIWEANDGDAGVPLLESTEAEGRIGPVDVLLGGNLLNDWVFDRLAENFLYL